MYKARDIDNTLERNTLSRGHEKVFDRSIDRLQSFQKEITFDPKLGIAKQREWQSRHGLKCCK